MLVLSNAQVAVILQASADSATHDRDEELNAVYQKTQQYVNRFNSMNNAEKERQEIVDELDNLQEYVLFVNCNCIFAGDHGCLGWLAFDG
jgi:DNA-directed RNA polymerase subunit F